MAKEVGGVPLACVGEGEEKLVSFSLCSKKERRFAKIAQLSLLSLRAFSEDVSLVCVAISWRFKSSFSISWGVEAGVAFFLEALFCFLVSPGAGMGGGAAARSRQLLTWFSGEGGGYLEEGV